MSLFCVLSGSRIISFDVTYILFLHMVENTFFLWKYVPATGSWFTHATQQEIETALAKYLSF